jgi:F-type H+-transporting ATPase subunit epsilon
MVMADSFNFELVSPERLLVSGSVSEVVIPATEGEMTVMANHAPTMTTIKPGVVTVTFADGKKDRYVVFGGFADIVPTGCTLLAESAVHANEFKSDDISRRIEAARTELGEATSDEHRFGIETYLAQLTTLQGAILPA